MNSLKYLSYWLVLILLVCSGCFGEKSAESIETGSGHIKDGLSELSDGMKQLDIIGVQRVFTVMWKSLESGREANEVMQRTISELQDQIDRAPKGILVLASDNLYVSVSDFGGGADGNGEGSWEIILDGKEKLISGSANLAKDGNPGKIITHITDLLRTPGYHELEFKLRTVRAAARFKARFQMFRKNQDGSNDILFSHNLLYQKGPDLELKQKNGFLIGLGSQN